MVLTDSKGAPTQILGDKGHKSSNYEMRNTIYQSARTISRNGGHVSIGWIPSHCGVKGNEKADELAAIGAREGRKAYSPPTKKEVACKVQKSSVEQWKRQWDGDVTGRFRYEVEPHLKKVELTWQDDVLWSRLRMGTAWLALWR